LLFGAVRSVLAFCSLVAFTLLALCSLAGRSLLALLSGLEGQRLAFGGSFFSVALLGVAGFGFFAPPLGLSLLVLRVAFGVGLGGAVVVVGFVCVAPGLAVIGG